MINIKEEIQKLADEVECTLTERFWAMHKTTEQNTKRVLEAFQNNRVSDSCFAGTLGYGYDDKGREVLDKVYAEIFGAQAALVRLGLVNGTHAISAALFAATAPGEILLSITGAPYDTLRDAIGITGVRHGSLKFYGVLYEQIELLANGDLDEAEILKRITDEKVKTVFLQRSRGYSTRPALSISAMESMITKMKEKRPDLIVVVDNCYGEFTEEREPTHVGANLIAGSLIKNPGGGLAPTGGYVAGDSILVQRAAARLTSPGIDGECGPTLGMSRLLFQGIFMAPHVVCEALKTVVFCAAMLEKLGFETSPGPQEHRSDIIQMVHLKTPENLQRFCRGIQHGSPIDSYVTPEPWQMPGYDCPVIMAAGAFVQGASIELSADGPMREPYPAFLQGGLTYASGKLGVLMALSEMLDGQ